MRKIRIVINIVVILALVSILTGCWDRAELENKAYVIGLGIDRSKHEGKITVSMLIANPEVGSMQGGGGSTEKPRELITFEANDLITAKSTANAVVSRKISYELLKVIIVSEEFAKDSMFLPVIYSAVHDKEVRLNTYLAISKEKAHEYFHHNVPRLETRPHKYFQYMITHGIDNGFIPDSNLFRFLKTIERGTDLAVAMYTTAEKEKNPPYREADDYMAGQLNVFGELDETQFLGLAVFRNGMMTAKLTGQETRIINILDDTTNIKDTFVNIPDPFSNKKSKIAARVLKTDPIKFKMTHKGTRPKITITIPLKFEIMTNPSVVNFVKSKKNREILKKQIEQQMITMYEDFIKKLQTEIKGTPFPLSTYALKYFETNQEFEEFNWTKSFPQAEISIKADVTIIDFAKQDKRIKKNGGQNE